MTHSQSVICINDKCIFDDNMKRFDNLGMSMLLLHERRNTNIYRTNDEIDEIIDGDEAMMLPEDIYNELLLRISANVPLKVKDNTSQKKGRKDKK
jgi:hypothetical protein